MGTHASRKGYAGEVRVVADNALKFHFRARFKPVRALHPGCVSVESRPFFVNPRLQLAGGADILHSSIGGIRHPCHARKLAMLKKAREPEFIRIETQIRRLVVENSVDITGA